MTQDINGATRLICLFGDPVAHSKSPHLHNRAFERAGLNYAYMAFRVPGEDMKQATDAIRLLNMRGCNLTMPNKIAVIPFLDKLDPIEWLPDGSLFRLTPGQLRSVRGLTKRCCNFLDGDCLLLDGVCPQFISRSLICRWFRRAVLPQQPKLEQAILSPKKLRRCEVCGTGILARSGRTKYCPACAKEVHRQQKAKSARKRRTGVDNSGAKSP